MTAMIDARALWWTEPETCACGNPDEDDCSHDPGGWPSPLFSFTYDGAMYLTDRYVLLPVSSLGGLPVGYGNLLTPAYRQAEEGLINWLTATPIPEPSDRVFDRDTIGLIEAAGFLVRPLEGVKEAHGICDSDLPVIGLTMPVPRRKVADAGDNVRVASR